MKLSERIKSHVEATAMATREGYIHSAAYDESVKNIVSSEFPNLEYVNRVAHWQFFAPTGRGRLCECLYSKFGPINAVFDEWGVLSEGKITHFYIQQLHNENANFVIDNITALPSIEKAPNEVVFGFPPDLEPCRTKSQASNNKLMNMFIDSKLFNIDAIAEDIFRITKK